MSEREREREREKSILEVKINIVLKKIVKKLAKCVKLYHFLEGKIPLRINQLAYLKFIILSLRLYT